MPKIVDAEAQRAQIRSAARRVFSRQRQIGLGLTHVAREAGISRSALYHYYDGKSDLLRDLARELLDEEEALFREALNAEGSVADRLETLADKVVDRFSEWAKVGGALLKTWVEDPIRVRRLFRDLRSDLTEILRRGQKAGEIDPRIPPEATATLLIGMIDGLVVQVYLDARALPSKGEMRAALGAVLHGVLRPEGERNAGN